MDIRIKFTESLCVRPLSQASSSQLGLVVSILKIQNGQSVFLIVWGGVVWCGMAWKRQSDSVVWKLWDLRSGPTAASHRSRCFLHGALVKWRWHNPFLIGSLWMEMRGDAWKTYVRCILAKKGRAGMVWTGHDVNGGLVWTGRGVGRAWCGLGLVWTGPGVNQKAKHLPGIACWSVNLSLLLYSHSALMSNSSVFR